MQYQFNQQSYLLLHYKLNHSLEKNVHYFSQLSNKLTTQILIKLMATISQEQSTTFNVVFNQRETGRKMLNVIIFMRFFNSILNSREVAVLIKTEDQNEIVLKENNKRRRATKTFEELIAYKKQYDYFGEIAIEQRIPGTVTVIAKEPCTFAIITFDAQLIIY
ncbi:unnamed protein product [Paramecium sonneborni]|uniref:Cyclic nucleotide-binding domain-containing protein n=1 Tax=Paramecium sonneborni TaxID=65129 RepID=A0A8S1RUQ5_9CILI|nr:unnamed protein product [Paramecium sonneborni]